MSKAARSNRRIRAGRGKTRGFRLFVSFVCVVLIGAALLSAAVIFLKIGEIRVTGDTGYYTAEDIIAASGLRQGESMYLFNKFASISSIFSQCPFIDTVRMRRKLPDEIEIMVTPCRPVVGLLSDDEYYVLDIKGKILEKRHEVDPAQLHVVMGAHLEFPEVGKMSVFSEEETSKALFYLLNTAEKSDILVNIGGVDISKVYDIKYKYLDRFIVCIGTVDELERKLKFVDAVVGSLAENDMGVIDVSDGRTGYFTPDRNNIS